MGNFPNCQKNNRSWIEEQWKKKKYDTIFDIGEASSTPSSAPTTPLKRRIPLQMFGTCSGSWWTVWDRFVVETLGRLRDAWGGRTMAYMNRVGKLFHHVLSNLFALLRMVLINYETVSKHAQK